MQVSPRYTSSIDPGFVPASLWTKEFLKLCQHTRGSSALAIGLSRPDGTASVFRTMLLPAGSTNDADNLLHVERTVKFLLWARSGNLVLLSGEQAPALVKELQAMYAPGGVRSFDADFARKLFELPLTFRAVAEQDLPAESTSHLPLGRNLGGCRIGFDLGGSDRHLAALPEYKAQRDDIDSSINELTDFVAEIEKLDLR